MFTNRVQTVTQKQYCVEKQAGCTKCTACWPNSTPRCAQAARLRPTPRTPCPRSPRAPSAPPACPAPCRSAHWPYRGRAPRAPLALQHAVSQYSLCLMPLPFKRLQSRYNVFIVTQLASPAKSLAIQILQYNPCQVSFLLQYNKLYCNTVSLAARLLKSQYNCCIAIQIHSHLSP